MPSSEITLGKAVDADLRILQQAEAEYAKRVLSSTSSRRVKVPLALKMRALYPKAGVIPRWPKKAEGMQTSKRARKRKLDTAKAELEPLP